MNDTPKDIATYRKVATEIHIRASFRLMLRRTHIRHADTDRAPKTLREQPSAKKVLNRGIPNLNLKIRQRNIRKQQTDREHTACGSLPGISKRILYAKTNAYDSTRRKGNFIYNIPARSILPQPTEP